MEMTIGLAVYGLSVLLLLWFATRSVPVGVAALLENDLMAGIACALLTAGLILGLLLVYFGTEAILGTPRLAAAASVGAVVATVALGRLARRSGIAG
ncbi:hypothetical protein CSC94_14930 [Zhengella mangrovi]|uniref:Uncharacterized protein n=1 Tax=Zhengella mangrovi TaxID=1982044 RepID=A0A2G1QL30_9HYPH|nr:hypothetical protein [Zhengella mangrovi]PHP66226.1 hypothetical protein CSC94_14930 [Zhengella mangrovi]